MFEGSFLKNKKVGINKQSGLTAVFFYLGGGECFYKGEGKISEINFVYFIVIL